MSKPTAIQLQVGKEETPWVYLDPDYRKDEPEGFHCCRCMKKVKDTQYVTGFLSVEVHPEYPWVRKSIKGTSLIGEDCWNKIKNDLVKA